MRFRKHNNWVYSDSLDWILERRKDVNAKTGEVRTKSMVYKHYTTVNFLVMTKVPWICEMLKLGETRWKVWRLPVLTLPLFCKLKLLQTKLINNKSKCFLKIFRVKYIAWWLRQHINSLKYANYSKKFEICWIKYFSTFSSQKKIRGLFIILKYWFMQFVNLWNYKKTHFS